MKIPWWTNVVEIASHKNLNTMNEALWKILSSLFNHFILYAYKISSIEQWSLIIIGMVNSYYNLLALYKQHIIVYMQRIKLFCRGWITGLNSNHVLTTKRNFCCETEYFQMLYSNARCRKQVILLKEIGKYIKH